VNDPLGLAEAALAAAGGEEAEAVVQTELSGYARFAGSVVHQPTLIENHVVQLRIAREGRVGSATTNRTSDDALAELARRAAEAVDNAPVDPGFPGFAPAASVPEVDGRDEETAALAPADQARLAEEAIAAARPYELYGYFTSGVVELAVATSQGLAASQRATDASVLALAALDGASGYAEQEAWRVAAIDAAAAGVEAAEKAAATRGAHEVEPGPYRAVLEPYAFAELLDYFATDTFSGLGILEEASFFAGRLGKRVFAGNVSITEDPLDSAGLPKSLDFEGTPRQRVPIAEEGVARGVVWDRATAARAGGGQQSTGNAVPLQYRRYGPSVAALTVGAGDAESYDELTDRIGDGIYITRLHYLSVVSPREGIITGMTRDGTFRIREGRRAEPLVNLRFTVAVPEMFADVPGLTRERKLVNRTQWYDERYAYGFLVPGIATARFTITGNGSGPGL
jgi:PmbA protein